MPGSDVAAGGGPPADGVLAAPDAASLAQAVLDEEARRVDETGSGRSGGTVLPDDLLPGVGGADLPWREVVRAGGPSMLVVLFALNLVDEFDRVALVVLGPEIQRTFGLSDAALSAINGIGAVLVFAGAIPLGVLADRRRRTTIVAVTSVIWAVFALAGGLTRTAWQLAATRVVNGLGKANGPVHSSLLADTYPIGGRSRVFAAHGFANPVGNALGPLLAGGVAALAGGDEGWRWALVVLALPCLILGLLAFRLREPSRGRYEQLDVLGAEAAALAEPVTVSLSAGFARLRKISSFSYVMAGVGALGFTVFGAPTVFNLLLERRYDLGALERGIVGTVIAIGMGIGFPVGGRVGDRLFREDPPRLLHFVGGLVAVFGLAYPLSLYLPNLPLVVAALTLSSALVGAASAPTNSLVSAIIPYRLRGLGFAMVGIYLVLFGGFVGGVITGAISDSLGERAALTLVVPPSCITGGLLIAYAGRFVRHDISLTVEELREEMDEVQRVGKGEGETPLLQVRNLDFSYGSVQVLFDVHIEVREGEVLALLGTNGAGKSTLLRAVSGLALPDRGVVRLDGRTITLADPKDRVALGIVQVPGGKAVFPALTVDENLLVAAHRFVWDRELLDRRLARVHGLFPVLQERGDQAAGLLSGGEQQMLAIAKALMLEPRLLLIDELSLGLAPVVVQQLLAVVEQLKAEGVTMVIVEQSVNVALALADRAIFMEKGTVRFEGAARDLAERDDLVRAVFLGREGG